MLKERKTRKKLVATILLIILLFTQFSSIVNAIIVPEDGSKGEVFEYDLSYHDTIDGTDVLALTIKLKNVNMFLLQTQIDFDNTKLSLYSLLDEEVLTEYFEDAIEPSKANLPGQTRYPLTGGSRPWMETMDTATDSYVQLMMSFDVSRKTNIGDTNASKFSDSKGNIVIGSEGLLTYTVYFALNSGIDASDINENTITISNFLETWFDTSDDQHVYQGPSFVTKTGLIAPQEAKTDKPILGTVLNDNGTVKIPVTGMGSGTGNVGTGTTFKLYNGDPESGGVEIANGGDITFAQSITSGSAELTLTATANSELKKKINLGDLDNLYVVANDGTNADSNKVAVGDVPARTNQIENTPLIFDYSSGSHKLDLEYGTNTIVNPFTLRGTDKVTSTFDVVTGAEPAEMTIVEVENWTVDSGSSTTPGAITFVGNLKGTTTPIKIKANILTASSTKDMTAVEIKDDKNVTMSDRVNPGIDKDTLSYNIKVNANSEKLVLNPTILDSKASYKVLNGLGTEVTSNTVDLGAKGSTTVAKVEVTAQDSTTKTYIINAYRPYDDAALNNLGLQNGISIGTFNPSNEGPYTANVIGSTSTVTIDATLKSGVGSQTIYYGTTANPTGTNPQITLNATGTTSIYVKVVADDGVTSKTYQIDVTKAEINTDGRLSNIEITSPASGTISPSFNMDTKTYTINVPNNTTTVVLKPTANKLPTEIKVNGPGQSNVEVVSGTNTGSITLNTGDTLDTTVTFNTKAESGQTDTYTLVIHRKSSNADLSGLSVDGYNDKITFNKDVTAYNITLPYGTTTVPTIDGTVADSDATKVVTPGSIAMGVATSQIKVTAEDGNVKTYKVNFTVDSTRPSIAITGPDVTNAKQDDIITYTVTYTGYDTIDLVPSMVQINQVGVSGTTLAPTNAININSAAGIATIKLKAGSGDGTVGITINEGSAKNTNNSLAPSATSNTCIIDNTDPELSIGNPDKTITKSGPVTYEVTYTGADNITLTNSDVSIVSVDGVTGNIAVTAAGSTRTITVSNLTGNGKYKIEIAAATASDDSGNSISSTTQSGEVSVDNTAPTVTFGSNGATSVNDPETTITVTDNAVNSVQSGIDNTSLKYAWSTSNSVEPTTWTTFTNGVTITNSSVADGTYYLWVKASDIVGNDLTPTASNAFIKDTSFPGVTLNAPSGKTFAKQGETLEYTVVYDKVNASSIDLTGKVQVTGPATLKTIDINTATKTAKITVEITAGDGKVGVKLLEGTAVHEVDSSKLAPEVTNNIVEVDNTNPTITVSKDASTNAFVKSNTAVKLNVEINEKNIDTQNLTSSDISVKVGGVSVPSASISIGTSQTVGDKITYPITITGLTGDGDLEVTIKENIVTDEAGNKSAKNISTISGLTVDNIAPDITNIVDNQVTNTDVTPNIVETNLDTATGITLTKDSVTVPGYAGGLITDEGVYVLTITDKAGNSITKTFTIDKTAPTMTIGSPSSNQTKSGPISYEITYTGATSITLSNSDVTINSTDGVTGDISVTNHGTETNKKIVTISNLTGDGKYTIQIAAQTASDNAGNKANGSQSNQVSVDNTVPTITFASNGGDIKTDPSTVVTVQDPVVNGVNTGITGTLKYGWSTSDSVAPGSWSNFTNSDTITKTGSADGTFYLWIEQVTDGVGNQSNRAVSNAFTKDTIAPSITNPTNNLFTKNNVLPAYSDANIDTISLTKDGTIVSGYAGEELTQDGTYVLTITDKAGNNSTVTFTIDKTNPNITYPTNATTYNTNVTPIYSDTNLDTVELKKNGTVVSGYAGEEITADGVYVLTITDKAGNTSSVTFTIDQVLPTINISAPSATQTKSGPVTYTVTYTDVDSITLSNADVSIETTDGITGTIAVTGTGNTRTITISGLSGNGKYKVKVNAGSGSDNESNVTPQVISNEVIVDNTAPTITFTNNGGVSASDPSTTINVVDPVVNGVSTGISGTLQYAWTTNTTEPSTGWINFTSGQTITKTGATNGDYYLWVKQVSDNVGNTTSSKMSAKFEKDNTAPSASIGTPSKTDAKQNDTVTYTVTFENTDMSTIDTSKFVLAITGTATGTLSVTNGGLANEKLVTISNVTGNGTIGIKVEEQAGKHPSKNEYTTEVTSSIFNVDTIAPTVTNVTEGTITNQDVTPSYSETDVTVILKKNSSTIAYTKGTPITLEGEYSLTVTDKAGNTSTVNFEIDKTNPTISSPANNSVHSTSVTPAYTDKNLDYATLKKNSESAAPYASGTSITQDGIYVLTVVDKAGNTSNITFTIDTTAPDITFPANNSYHNTNITPIYTEISDTATLKKNSGTANPYNYGTAITDEGTYVLTVKDSANNQSSVTFTIDKTAPNISGITDDTYTKNNVTLTYSDTNIDTAMLQKDSDSPVAYTTGTTISAEGKYTLTVTDKAGNVSTRTFTIDKTNPSITYPTNNSYITSDVVPAYSDTNLDRATLKKNSGSDNAYALGTQITQDGTYLLTVYDKAGNTSSVTFTIEKGGPQITAIAINTPPTKNEYNYGDSLNLTGLVLDVTYSNSVTSQISAPNSDISATIQDVVGNSVVVTVTYKGKTTTFNVKVNDVLNNVTFTGPTKTSYEVGDTLNTSGISATESWAKAGNIAVGSSDISVDGYNTPLIVSNNKVTVWYKKGTPDQRSKDFTITVQDVIDSITLTANKSNYKYGESLDVNVTANYRSGATSTLNAGQYIATYKANVLGNQNITVTANGKTSNAVTVNVRNYITGIEITKPTKNKYKVGDTLDLTGGKITTINADGSKSTAITMDNTHIDNTSYNMSTSGGYNVKVSYLDTVDNKTYTRYFPILVTNPADTIAIDTTNEPKYSYNYGESLDLTKGAIEVTKADGSTDTILLSDSRVKVTGYNSKPTGFTSTNTQVPQTLTITYKETVTEVVGGETITDEVVKTLTYSVIVNDYYKGLEIVKPTKTEYLKGEKLDLTGGKVLEKMASGVTRTETALTASNTSGYEKDKLGEQTLTVTVGLEKITFKVKVTHPIEKIELEKAPSKSKYKQGEELDIAGGKIKVVYKNGEEELLDIEDSMISGYNKDKVGKQEITIKYAGKTVTFEINVEKVNTNNNTNNTTNNNTTNGNKNNTINNTTGTKNKNNTTNSLKTGTTKNVITNTNTIGENLLENAITDNTLEETNNIVNNEINSEKENNIPVLIGTTDGPNNIFKDGVLPVILSVVSLLGLGFILILVYRSKKNVEIYNSKDRLVGKMKITKDAPVVVLDEYQGKLKDKDFEIILKKSISKKLDNKNVTIQIGERKIKKKVKYDQEDFQIIVEHE